MDVEGEEAAVDGAADLLLPRPRPALARLHAAPEAPQKLLPQLLEAELGAQAVAPPLHPVASLAHPERTELTPSMLQGSSASASARMYSSESSCESRSRVPRKALRTVSAEERPSTVATAATAAIITHFIVAPFNAQSRG